MSRPKISVITVSFNHGEFLRQNIDSVLAQKYENFEHIIIDGGSTDDTVDILKSYSHLQWVSEPDRGQSDALNKGFEKASGDIIAWLNSDDWYPDGVFERVVQELQDAPIVMGACQYTDKQGVPGDIVPNVERSWFDILKYWVYFSSPAQPSIFFKRELLDQCRLENGKYIDEDLDYTMDYELWLRMTKLAPMCKRIPDVLSYYRNYDTNKTGQAMDAFYREFTSVYKRHAKRKSMSERSFCFLLPLDGPTPLLENFLGQIRSQSLFDAEVLVIDHAHSREGSKALRQQIMQAGDGFRPGALRLVRSASQDRLAALRQGLSSARADYLVSIPVDACIKPEFCLWAFNAFQQDNLALLIPAGADKELLDDLTVQTPEGRRFSYECLFQLGRLFPSFIVRSVASMDAGGFGLYPDSPSPLLAFRELAFKLLFAGWQIHVDGTLGVESNMPFIQDEQDFVDLFGNYINSHIICEIDKCLRSDAFAQLRVQNGFSFEFPAELVQAARSLLASAPADWMHLLTLGDKAHLEQVSHSHPHFAPAFYLLAKYFVVRGDSKQADSFLQRFNQAREHESGL